MSAPLRSRADRLAEHPLDWLGALLLSWVVPLGLAGHWWSLTYRLSLLFWLIPVLLLLPRFIARSRERNLRRAFAVTVLYVVVAGVVLDFILGSWILVFDHDGDYLLRLPSWSSAAGFVPIEEVFFYVLGAVAIILTYFWADEFWLERYKTPPAARENGPGLIIFSPQSLMVGLLLFALGVTVASLHRGAFRVPLYYSFLVAAAFVPAIGLYRSVKTVVNWRAFSLTTLYVLITSCIWEVTLALPNLWWGYQENAMMGEYVDSWKFGPLRYPVEALLVWLVVTFSSILTFEAVKTYHADRRPRRERLLGGARSS